MGGTQLSFEPIQVTDDDCTDLMSSCSSLNFDIVDNSNDELEEIPIPRYINVQQKNSNY